MYSISYPVYSTPLRLAQLLDNSIGILGGRRLSAKITGDEFTFSDGLGSKKLAFRTRRGRFLTDSAAFSIFSA